MVNINSTMPFPSINRQRGVNTLVVTLILLLLTSLLVFYTSRGAINEQHLSANEIRTKQAFDAANAGAENALAFFAKNGTGTITPGTLYSSSQQPSYYQAAFCSPSAALPTCATTNTAITCTAPLATESRSPLIVACGWSDDQRAVFRVVNKLAGTASLAGSITAPVVSQAVSNLLVGGASIFNYFNDLTVWAGGGVPIQSATGKTFIRNVATDPTPTSTTYTSTGNSPACNNPPTGYICATNGSDLGPDVITNDTALGSLSSSSFFSRFMGQAPTQYRDNVATYKVDVTGANTLTNPDSTSMGSLTGLNNQVIWVEATTAGGTVGTASGLSGQIGTEANPVVLVVNGNLDIGSNVTIYGLVFVTGQVTGTGSPTIYGSLISGSSNLNGNGKIIYDPTALSNARFLGKAAPIPGGWRDW